MPAPPGKRLESRGLGFKSSAIRMEGRSRRSGHRLLTGWSVKLGVRVLYLPSYLLEIPLDRLKFERSGLPAYLKQLELTGEGVEVGVNLGIYSADILEGSGLRVLYSVDPWVNVPGFVMKIKTPIEDRFIEATERLSAFGDRSVIVRKFSVDAAKDFQDSQLDFVYIDGDHRYEQCKQDLELWWPKIRPTGMLSGHDFRSNRDCGVEQAVLEFVAEHGLTYRLTAERGNPSWVIFKPLKQA